MGLTASKRYGYTLTLKIKYGNYETITRSRTRDGLIRELAEILQLSRDLLFAHLDLNRPVRLLGHYDLKLGSSSFISAARARLIFVT